MIECIVIEMREGTSENNTRRFPADITRHFYYTPHNLIFKNILLRSWHLINVLNKMNFEIRALEEKLNIKY